MVWVTDGHSLVSPDDVEGLRKADDTHDPIHVYMDCGLGGQENWIRCRRDMIYKKSSVLASISPRQTLGPDNKHTNQYSNVCWFNLFINLTNSWLSQWEGDESLQKFLFLSKKFSGLKASGCFQCSLLLKTVVRFAKIIVSCIRTI